MACTCAVSTLDRCCRRLRAGPQSAPSPCRPRGILCRAVARSLAAQAPTSHANSQRRRPLVPKSSHSPLRPSAASAAVHCLRQSDLLKSGGRNVQRRGAATLHLCLYRNNTSPCLSIRVSTECSHHLQLREADREATSQSHQPIHGRRLMATYEREVMIERPSTAPSVLLRPKSVMLVAPKMVPAIVE